MFAWMKRFWLRAALVAIFVLFSFATGAHLELTPFVLTWRSPEGILEWVQRIWSDTAITIVVATIVSEVVELRAREKFEVELKSMAENTIGGISKAIFRSIYSDGVIEECLASIFSSTLVRGPFKYEVRLDRVDGIEGVIRKTDILEYKIHNTSQIDASWTPRYMMDNNVGLFKHDAAFDKPRITFCQFGQHNFDPNELLALNDQVDGDAPEAHVEMGTFTIPGRSSMEVRIEVTKIEPDRWIAPMRIFIPTSEIRVEIDNRLGDDLIVHLSSMSRLGFRDAEYHGANRQRWHQDLKGLVLPGSGWIISWFNPHKRISSGGAAPARQSDHRPRRVSRRA